MSSRRKPRPSSSSDPRASSQRDERNERNPRFPLQLDDPLAGRDPRMTLPDRSRTGPGRPAHAPVNPRYDPNMRRSPYMISTGNKPTPYMQPVGSILPSTNFRHNSKVQPSSVQPSAAFRGDTKVATFKTAYTHPEDIKFAEKQRSYPSLSKAEKKEQDKWALEKLRKYPTFCTMGYPFSILWDQPGYEGYRCTGTEHLITHKLLSEGEEGSYMLNTWIDGNVGPPGGSMPQDMRWTHDVTWIGPMYNDGTGRPNCARPGGPSIQIITWRRSGSPPGSGLPSTDLTHIQGMNMRQIIESRPVLIKGFKHGDRPKESYVTHRSNEEQRPFIDRGGPCISPDSSQGGNHLGQEMPPGAINDPNYRANYKTIISDQDKAMAEKQLRFSTLSPAEQSIQKQWAKALLEKTAACPEGYSWWSYKSSERTPNGSKLEGYRCWAGGHMVTHELLVEDKGRIYRPWVDEQGKDTWRGPIWPGRYVGPRRTDKRILNVLDQRGEPKWKDPNWSFNIFVPPGEKSSSKKKKGRWW